jgi:hypothetical protein
MATTFTAIESGHSGTLYGSDGSSSTDWVGYYLPLAAANGSPPSSLTFTLAWSSYWGRPIAHVNGGCYVLFAKQPPTGTADAIGGLLTQLNQGFQGAAYRYVLWLATSTTNQLTLLASIPFAQKSGDTGAVMQTASIALRTLELAADVNCVLSPGADGQSLVLGPSGSSARLHLMQTRGTPTEVGQVTSPAVLSLGGTQAGGLAFDMNLTIYGAQVNNDFETLGLGLKYFYEVGAVFKSQLYPLLGLPSGQTTLPFTVKLDPLNGTDEALTRFTFQGGNPFSTSLRTTTGIPLTLNPVVGNAGLALAPDRVTPLGGGGQIDSYYPTLSGSFAIGLGASAPAGPLPMLCGMSGLESVSVTPTSKTYPGDVLTFHAGQPAFAPNFPPQAVSLDQPTSAGLDKPKLDTTMTTAWASLQPAEGTSPYYAQPHGAPLFGAATPSLGFLPFAEQQSGAAGESFPIAPYWGIEQDTTADGFDPSLLAAFEQAALSPTRRAAMKSTSAGLAAAAANGNGNGGNNLATTPQGFLVTLDGPSWSSLVLAQTVYAGETTTLEFIPVDPVVRAAFAANQLFLVATAAPWGKDHFKNFVKIEGWPFNVAVGDKQTFGSYSNVLIAKFCHGKLSDLIKDPRRWTDAEDFNNYANNELLAVSDWLQAYFADAASRSTDPPFDHFNQIADLDDWQGILVLRVDVPLKDLPSQVGALRAGLSQSTFYAHHLGIEVSKVSADGELSVDGNSSLFGLIDYLDPVYAAALGGGADPDTPIPSDPSLTYDFKVLRLLVVFENSEVKQFQSKSQVTLNKWFGDNVTTTRLGAGATITNSIVINGVLQHHDGQPLYLFTSAADTVFGLDSNVLPSVEVLSTALTTISDSPTGPSYFRFSFAGYMAFAALPGLDALSFGPPGSQASGGGLAFSDLFLDLEFDPAAAVPSVFTFTPDRIAFDTSLSTPRTTSLFASMPLTLKGLVVGGAGGPSKQGFLPVSLPGIALSTLPDQWYGLMFDFDLGTPGALAAETGWTAGLLVAWGTGSAHDSKTARASVGMQLPGAGGQSKLLSLQGILKLTIDQLVLTYVGGAYLLRLTNIALHFLSLQFPPSGQNAFYLFGDPAAAPGERSHTAWYAAYTNPTEQQAALEQ